MNILFFGAGASYGSSNASTPPLGPDLFPALQRHDPISWGRLTAPWPAKFSEDFEKAMAELIAVGIFAAPLQWAMADFFFKKFPIDETNLYIRLLQDIARSEQDVALVTINYDKLLFQAATGIVTLEIGNTKPKGNKLGLCLPHGSSVLKCESVRASAGVSFTGGVSTSGKIKLINDANEFDRERITNAFPPVMSYFEPNKFTCSGYNFIAEQRQIFSELIDGASRVAIIGVNVHPFDTHIWDPLKRTPATCFYLGGAAGAEKYRSWCQDANRGGDVVCERYFADGYDEMVSFILGI